MKTLVIMWNIIVLVAGVYIGVFLARVVIAWRKARPGRGK